MEVVLLTRNDAESGLRIINSIEAHKLSISRMAFTDGSDPYHYLDTFSCDLFLSAHQDDVSAALAAGFAAGRAYPPPTTLAEDVSEVRIAFDGDAVLFGDESERIYQDEGLEAFNAHERAMEDTPMNPGPFKGLLQAIGSIQQRFPARECPIRTALVTSRGGTGPPAVHQDAPIVGRHRQRVVLPERNE